MQLLSERKHQSIESVLKERKKERREEKTEKGNRQTKEKARKKEKRKLIKCRRSHTKRLNTNITIRQIEPQVMY